MLSESRPKKHGEKNTAEDIDREFFSLQRYLALLTQGQTIALDMLFAPDWALIEPPAQAWLELQSLAPRIITKGATAFVRYCRQQANKYGIKGARLAASRLAQDLLKQAEGKHGSQERLERVHDDLKRAASGNEFIQLSEGIQPNGDS